MSLDGRKEMSNKALMTFSDEDFGFTFADEASISETHVLSNQELTDKLQSMYDAIIPLLKNLSKNPDQEYIKWPNRASKIVEFKQKLDDIGGTSIKVKKL
jgi:hypothetical protein